MIVYKTRGLNRYCCSDMDDEHFAFDSSLVKRFDNTPVGSYCAHIMCDTHNVRCLDEFYYKICSDEEWEVSLVRFGQVSLGGI